MKITQLSVALCLFAASAVAQPLLLGRGLVGSISSPPPVVSAGTTCSTTTGCPGATINKPSTVPVTVAFNLYGKAGGAYLLIGSTAGVTCPIVMPQLGMSLLANPFNIAAGIMNLAGTPSCPGRATTTYTAPGGITFWVQSVQDTPNGSVGWTTPIKFVL